MERNESRASRIGLKGIPDNAFMTNSLNSGMKGKLGVYKKGGKVKRECHAMGAEVGAARPEMSNLPPNANPYATMKKGGRLKSKK